MSLEFASIALASLKFCAKIMESEKGEWNAWLISQSHHQIKALLYLHVTNYGTKAVLYGEEDCTKSATLSLCISDGICSHFSLSCTNTSTETQHRV